MRGASRLWAFAVASATGCLLPPEGEPAGFNVPPSYDPQDRYPSGPTLRVSAGQELLQIPQGPPQGVCVEFEVGVRDVQDPDSDRVLIRWVKNDGSEDPNAPPALLAEDEQSGPADPFDVPFRVVPPDDFEREVQVASFIGSQRGTLHLFLTDAPDWAPVDETTSNFSQILLPADADPDDFRVVEVVWSFDFFQDNTAQCPDGEVQ
ncbi:MAG TPA: hypothetical protein RMG48_13065 [Myxococcales bacterium LLY-WYZ-16_1]|nr:hypothetical protein [Myxococcales bacterium LLY-WYZ-16_1]